MWPVCGMGILPMLARLAAFTAKLRFTGWEARATDHIATGLVHSQRGGRTNPGYSLCIVAGGISGTIGSLAHVARA